MKIKLFGGLLVIVALIGVVSVAHGALLPRDSGVILTWSSKFVPCSSGASYCSWEGEATNGVRKLPQDSSLTGITVQATGLPVGSTVEACVSVSRNGGPTYPAVTAGYSELMCWHAMRHASKDDWSATVDLSATPLYLPANTNISCGANLDAEAKAKLTTTAVADTHFDCNISYNTYTPGTPRYRMLRLPYNDQVPAADGSFASSYYIASWMFPLHVKGVNLFQSFGGDSTPATLTNACLKWIHQGGALVQKACFPDQSVSPSTNYTSPAFMQVDWTLPTPDLLTATAEQTRQNTDAAFFVLTEIPSAITPGPENIFRDYGTVPRPFQASWCAQYVSELKHPYYCQNQASCSNEMKINQCIALFPSATCESTGTCLTPLLPAPLNPPIYEQHIQALLDQIQMLQIQLQKLQSLQMYPGNTTAMCVQLPLDFGYGARDMSTGGNVSLLQDFLQVNGYLASEPTGYFGLFTLNAVKAFQTNNGITSTGYVGPLTMAKIKSLTCQ